LIIAEKPSILNQNFCAENNLFMFVLRSREIRNSQIVCGINQQQTEITPTEKRQALFFGVTRMKSRVRASIPKDAG
jgi:hypothetical protein